MANYNYVIDSSFQPFSMQELLTPFMLYKDAFDQSEAAYTELQKEADVFKYLAEETENNPTAKAIYEGYVNDLNKYAEDLSRNGLSVSNRRGLTGLKRRYQGEIGRLKEANTALKKELELRRQMSAKDPSMLYALDNGSLNLDSFLDDNTPNLYNISGTDLYTRGAAAGKAASSRIFRSRDGGSTLGGYYRDYVQSMGYTPEQLSQFGEQIANDFAAKVSTLPELQLAANQILEANGVTGNLTGESLRRAQQQVIRGLIDGAVYTESHSPQRDYGKLTASEIAHLRASGFDEQGNYHAEWDPAIKKAKAIAEIKAGTGTGTTANGTKKTGGSGYGAIINGNGIRLEWKGNNPGDTNGEADNDMEKPKLIPDDEEYVGTPVEFEDLPLYIRNKITKLVGEKGNMEDYIYYYRPYEEGIFDDTEAAVDIVPRKIQKGTGPEDEVVNFGDTGNSPDTEDDEDNE